MVSQFIAHLPVLHRTIGIVQAVLELFGSLSARSIGISTLHSNFVETASLFPIDAQKTLRELTKGRHLDKGTTSNTLSWKVWGHQIMLPATPGVSAG